ncbi:MULTISPECIES: helix-turn-helix domain-containing protein [unclassified Sphingobacterium]|uniref:helix-turn-helix domain-containing protein n=1 Tax=unclassified Sphingobacterium TaxID=2609468 RepID=UPI0025D0C1B4|nr:MULTISPECIES: helix-turn-helix domain-containing protein [unclassified Sphingobacterium]
MKDIYLYNFYKKKYGKELLIDVISLQSIKDNILKNPIHRLTYYDITFVTEGSEIVCVNGNESEAKPSTAICSIPGDIWQWNPQTKLNGYVLVFEEQFLLSFFNDPYFLQNFPYLSPDRASSMLLFEKMLFDKVINLLSQIKDEINVVCERDQHLLRAMLYELLILLNRSTSIPEDKPAITDNTESRHLKTFVDLVKTNYIENRNIGHYADQICITSNYLNKIVRQALGISPKKYIDQKIVQESCRLLLYTSQSISEIADKLHFNSSSYFIRFFTKNTGSTPLDYRRKINS